MANKLQAAALLLICLCTGGVKPTVSQSTSVSYQVVIHTCGHCNSFLFRRNYQFTFTGQGTNKGASNFLLTDTGGLQFINVNGGLLFPTSSTVPNCPGIPSSGTFNGVTKCLWDIAVVAGNLDYNFIRVEVDLGWDANGVWNNNFVVGATALGSPHYGVEAGLTSAKVLSATPLPSSPATCPNGKPLNDVTNCRACGNDCSKITTITTSGDVVVGYSQCQPASGCVCPNGQGYGGNHENCSKCGDKCGEAQICAKSNAVWVCFP